MDMALKKYYMSKGYDLPKYSYINLGDKGYCAELILPNGVTIQGETRHSYFEVSNFYSNKNKSINNDILWILVM